MVDIAQENLYMYKRLKDRPPTYDMKKLLKDYIKNQYYKQNACRYPSIDFYKVKKNILYEPNINKEKIKPLISENNYFPKISKTITTNFKNDKMKTCEGFGNSKNKKIKKRKKKFKNFNFKDLKNLKTNKIKNLLNMKNNDTEQFKNNQLNEKNINCNIDKIKSIDIKNVSKESNDENHSKNDLDSTSNKEEKESENDEESDSESSDKSEDKDE